jgi:hypothetical protein
MAGFDKEKLQELAERAKEWAQLTWAEFRRNSVFYQLRVGLVVGYVGIVLATLLLAPPSPPTYKLLAGSVPWGVGQRTYLDVDNLELGTLKKIVIEVHGSVMEFDGKVKNGPWKVSVSRLSEGDTRRVWPEQLIGPDQKPAGNNLRITRVVIYEEGDPGDPLVDDAPQQKLKKKDEKR